MSGGPAAPDAEAEADADGAAFARRVRAGLRTVRAWDDDPSLLAECRRLIPFRDLAASLNDDDGSAIPASRNLRFLRRLAQWFRTDFMTWVDRPHCAACGPAGPALEFLATRGPETPAERAGGAHRVESYRCPACGGAAAFPRYTAPRRLLAERRGRCGEYANLFGLLCRACGLEARQVSDWTDHVWNEVHLDGAWVMVDPCEGVVDECSMYEAGWGKRLSLMVAAARDHVVDVTPRYTRRFQDADLQARRRGVVSSERQLASVLASLNASLQQGISPKRRDEMERRLRTESKTLDRLKTKTIWDKTYHYGRISGSWIWKVQRHEAGSPSNLYDTETEDTHETGYEIESFFPPTSPFGVYIQLDSHPKDSLHGIVVSGTACAVGKPHAVSVVVVDQEFLGCILQSRSFSSIQALANFVESIPLNRIVAIHGLIPSASEDNIDDATMTKLQRLGGIRIDLISSGVLFIGQLNSTPTSWTICEKLSEMPKRYSVHTKAERPNVVLARLPHVRPTTVVGRLPDSAMPLAAQLVASEDQKRLAFTSYMKEQTHVEYAGFVTRDGTSIYLIGANAFPFERLASDDSSWSTFLFLPPTLAQSTKTINQTLSSCMLTPIQIEVPLNFDFYVQSIGPEVLRQPDLSKPVNTVSALSGARLIAFYFSAHWCGPCRSFTPLLVEMYLHLKEKVSEQGLEIVFVSSDRDESSFRAYYSTMPWLAIPFKNLVAYKHMLSTIYGVQGIPSLVILDSVSGEIVSPVSMSRNEVIQAYRQGYNGIESLFQSWLDCAPSATKEMIQMLEISCTNNILKVSNEDLGSDDANIPTMNKNDIPVDGSRISQLEAMDGLFEIISDAQWSSEQESPRNPMDLLSKSGEEASIKILLETALAYLENVTKVPHNPRYRSFKLSNKIADRITRVKGGLELIRTFGFDIIAMDSDFYATVLLDIDVDAEKCRITGILESAQQLT